VLESTDVEGTKTVRVVIEMKQYLRPKLKSFAETLEDYVRAHTEAIVVLSDYGPLPSATLLARIEPPYRERAFAVGDVHPGSLAAVEEVKSLISANVPGPPRVPASGAKGLSEIREVVVDLSASMDRLLGNEEIIATLRELDATLPLLRWIGVDESIRAEGVGTAGLRALLDIPRDRGTKLAASLRGRELGATLIITDDDGYAQLEHLVKKSALRVAVARGSTIEWDAIP
jgi:GNAT superfamily N-acetyltransferase